MDIDPTTAEALRAVRKRLFVEEVAGQLSEGMAAEFRDFVGAARQLADDVQRLAAAHAAAERVLAPDLVTAINTLISCAIKGISSGVPLKNAIVTARSYLPPSVLFNPSDYPGLAQAFNAVRNIADKTQPRDGETMRTWPDRCGEVQALYVANVLTTALTAIDQHAEAIAEHHPHNESLTVPNLRGHLLTIQRRVDELRAATGADVPQHAALVHHGVQSLASYLPAGQPS